MRYNSSKYSLPAFFTLCAMALMVAGCHKEKKENYSDMVRPVEVAEAFSDSVVLYHSYPAYLLSEYYAEVVGLVNGRLETMNYSSGQYVKKGQVLFTIDPTIYIDALHRAEATLKSNESNLQYAKSHYEAVLKALEDNAVSRMEVLQAESDFLQAEASVKDAKAALHTAQVNYGYCTVTAPISGYATNNVLSTGNYITGADSPVKLAEIYDNTHLYVDFEVEDSRYEAMRAASNPTEESILYKNVPLQFQEPLRHTYTADLTYVAPAVDRSTGTITLQGKITNKDNELKQGMYVTVTLPYGENPHATLVKDASIATDQLGKYMYVVNDSDIIVKRRLDVGEIYQDSLRVINKGISPGDKYITKALLTVRAGEKVKPILTR
ncbi:MAG: efflux RND transporter periplasmic adaptor subunit [Muribaculaceae bacterium]|nr:efflux RND transporter periplasmic adaptor subunit [Muribaculaceae bacterium]